MSTSDVWEDFYGVIRIHRNERITVDKRHFESADEASKYADTIHRMDGSLPRGVQAIGVFKGSLRW